MIPIDEKIKHDFDEVIKYSQISIKNPKTDYYFKHWAEEKEYFYNAFGQKLIYEFPEKICFPLDKEVKQEKFDRFLSALETKKLYRLQEFVSKQRSDGFFNNIVIADYDKDIKKNMKLVKAFKFFIEDKEQLEDIQNYASQIIQEDKVEGKLCFSIHPLDYLSVSENTHKWRSCHALDGEYRAGNLSYMLDSCTFICYLKSDNDTKLPHFPENVPWNDKKWRVLFFLNSTGNLIVAGRQYPFSSQSGLDWILANAFSKIFASSSSEWKGWESFITKATFNKIEYTLDNQYISDGSKIFDVTTFIENVEGSKQFNDILYSSYYTPSYAYLRKCSDDDTFWAGYFPNYRYYLGTIRVGGYTPCLHCGTEETLDEGDMLCHDCEMQHGVECNEYFTFCDCCGARIEISTNGNYIDEDVLCNNCFDEHAGVCAGCNGTFYNSELIQAENGETYCGYCWEEREEDE